MDKLTLTSDQLVYLNHLVDLAVGDEAVERLVREHIGTYGIKQLVSAKKVLEEQLEASHWE